HHRAEATKLARRGSIATDQTAGTASCDQTVASSAGGGHAGSRVDVLATTQTSANAWPTTTASLRSNSPSALGASDHSASSRRTWSVVIPYARSVIDLPGR